MLSASSANCGSSASRGEAPPSPAVPLAPAVCVDVDARKEDREEGRSGVVGRDSGAGERERVRCADVDGARLCDMVDNVEGVAVLCVEYMLGERETLKNCTVVGAEQ